MIGVGLDIFKKIKWYIIGSAVAILAIYIGFLNLKIYSLEKTVKNYAEELLNCKNTIAAKDSIILDVRRSCEIEMKNMEKSISSRFLYRISQLESENNRLKNAISAELLNQDFSEAKKIKDLKIGNKTIGIFIKDGGIQ